MQDLVFIFIVLAVAHCANTEYCRHQCEPRGKVANPGLVYGCDCEEP